MERRSTATVYSNSSSNRSSARPAIQQLPNAGRASVPKMGMYVCELVPLRSKCRSTLLCYSFNSKKISFPQKSGQKAEISPFRIRYAYIGEGEVYF